MSLDDAAPSPRDDCEEHGHDFVVIGGDEEFTEYKCRECGEEIYE